MGIRLSEAEYIRLMGGNKEEKKPAKTKNRKMANKGKNFESEIELVNQTYKSKGIASVQKISTPWQVIRNGKKIVSAFPIGKSTLDFRGTIKPGISISFDCKETKEEKGLPLSNIADHQINYIKTALEMGEVSFILCYVVPMSKRYFIRGQAILDYWDNWKANKGKRGYNTILIKDMTEVKPGRGVSIDYEPLVKNITKES